MSWIENRRIPEAEQFHLGGKIAGTLQYIAPEIINKWPYDERSDIFLLGLILYEIVFMKPGLRPLENQGRSHLQGAALHIRPFTHHFRCRVVNDLKMIIAKALPPTGKRYQSVKELEKDLVAFSLAMKCPPIDTIFDKLLRKVRLRTKCSCFLPGPDVFLYRAHCAGPYREVDYRRLSSKKTAPWRRLMRAGFIPVRPSTASSGITNTCFRPSPASRPAVQGR